MVAPVSQLPLGRLEAVDLREIWQHEASDFTSWLAQPDNLRLLGDTLGLSLELEAQEQGVGPFRADLLCKELGGDSWVLIENQLERTDHGHLGQLITYAAGLEAANVVWLSSRFTEEHRAALDWLNEITSEKYSFFGVEVEVWRIGQSPAAPKFNLVSKPNDWTKSVQQKAEATALTPNRQLQLSFWTDFREFLKHSSKIRAPKPQPQAWMPHPIGRSGFLLCSIASLYDSAADSYDASELRVEMLVNHRDAKAYFATLEKDRLAIERDLGISVAWHNPATSRQAKIYVRRSGDLQDKAAWPEYFTWLKSHLELFFKVFEARIRNLQPSNLGN